MASRLRPALFLLFFFSGFCGLVYQVVWTRLAFASFGIITPVLSVVISVFMLGLGLGSWWGGKWIERAAFTARLSPIVYYAAAEMIIGIGAFVVPALFKAGEHWLLTAGQTDSAGYLFSSAVVLGLSVLPWCFCMGTTFPFMMAYVREAEGGHSPESFSYFYLGNVLGAMGGAIVTAVALVEMFGFKDTLMVAAAINFCIALSSVWIVRERITRAPAPIAVSAEQAAAAVGEADPRPSFSKAVLFTTGFVSMALEVVWTRAFAPVLKTQVYSFAMVVAAYLGATFAGSWLYRYHYRAGKARSAAELIGWLCTAALLPIIANDPRWVRAIWFDPTPHGPSVILILASILPFCAVLGYLTPSLIDRYSAGAPEKAGEAYALNVAGCIVGPLVGSYLILPAMGERMAQLVLVVPLLAFLLSDMKALPRQMLVRIGAATAVALGIATLFSRNFEETIIKLANKPVVKRDHAASVLAFTHNNWKSLLVNGLGMTKLTPITKCMAHLPLAYQQRPPQSALVICFGMGTSYRSSLSWGIPTTAVELVPGVVKLFDYFHDDARQVLANPKGTIVIDDGRRFLSRTREKFDMILVDPPPPVESAGSSLLYSKEFYLAAKRRLTDGGIMQAWVPEDIGGIEAAALRPLTEVFPYVRCFRSLEGWGLHLLASDQPILGSIEELLQRMPENAKADMVEWDSVNKPETYLRKILSQEIPPALILEKHPGTRITDDEPFNEYYLLRHWKVL